VETHAYFRPTIKSMELAEQLVGEARERRQRRMDRSERTVDGVAAFLFLAVGLAMALTMPVERHPSVLLVAALVAGYVVVSRVRFEFGEAWVSPEDVVFVPMLLLVPPSYIPLLLALAGLVSAMPDIRSGSLHGHRWITSVGDPWCFVGPALVVGLLAAGPPSIDDAPIYALAFAAQIPGDFGWALIRNRLVNPIPFGELCRNYLAVTRVSAVLWPIGFIAGIVGSDEPLALLALGPLVLLLHQFSRDRRGRYNAALELHRAYRGTVMLLSDVVEFEDPYTADHSRSVVELVQRVGDELEVPEHDRQELEFAALLHDVGKIAIPKEILNKPAKLTDEEFEIVKGHTIEGQFMLDRVGGFLGRIGVIVRACHERWDGKGYPDGLAGEEIPLAARIVFTCDAYNAMTTDRVYRRALSDEDARAELRSNAGTQFDPRVVTALTRSLEEDPPAIPPVDDVRQLLSDIQASERVSAASSPSAG
jgi:HD-GYP domain-containing protein (c-di-GMP phosphodiesterase class II)